MFHPCGEMTRKKSSNPEIFHAASSRAFATYAAAEMQTVQGPFSLYPKVPSVVYFIVSGLERFAFVSVGADFIRHFYKVHAIPGFFYPPKLLLFLLLCHCFSLLKYFDFWF